MALQPLFIRGWKQLSAYNSFVSATFLITIFCKSYENTVVSYLFVIEQIQKLLVRDNILHEVVYYSEGMKVVYHKIDSLQEFGFNIKLLSLG